MLLLQLPGNLSSTLKGFHIPVAVLLFRIILHLPNSNIHPKQFRILKKFSVACYRNLSQTSLNIKEIGFQKQEVQGSSSCNKIRSRYSVLSRPSLHLNCLQLYHTQRDSVYCRQNGTASPRCSSC